MRSCEVDAVNKYPGLFNDKVSVFNHVCTIMIITFRFAFAKDTFCMYYSNSQLFYELLKITSFVCISEIDNF